MRGHCPRRDDRLPLHLSQVTCGQRRPALALSVVHRRRRLQLIVCVQLITTEIDQDDLHSEF